MSVLEDELRRVLGAYGATAKAPAAGRLGAVERRIARIRGRRVATTVTAVVAVLACTSGIALAGTAFVGGNGAGSSHQPTVPAASGSVAASSSGLLPPEFHGHRLVLAQSATMPRDSRVTLTFTLQSWDMRLAAACNGPREAWIGVYVNGKFVGSARCSPQTTADLGMVASASDAELFWRQFGAQLGAPVTISASLGAAPATHTAPPSPISVQGEATVGIYQTDSGH